MKRFLNPINLKLTNQAFLRVLLTFRAPRQAVSFYYKETNNGPSAAGGWSHTRSCVETLAERESWSFLAAAISRLVKDKRQT